MKAMSTKSPKARRKTRRKGVRTQVESHGVKGVLTRGVDRSHAPFIVWDLSEEGVGIWLPLELKSGEEVTLNVGKPKPLTVKGNVVWCEMRPGKLGFHAGVLIHEGQNRLISMHRHLLEIEAFAFEKKMEDALERKKH